MNPARELFPRIAIAIGAAFAFTMLAQALPVLWPALAGVTP